MPAEIREVIDDPGTRRFARNIIIEGYCRDIVDVLEDLQFCFAIFQAKFDRMVEEGGGRDTT
jgi:hypothetical protein